MVKRHDIDGVHIDDYFYPYPVQLPAGSGTDLPFPDEESDPRDRLGGGQQPHDDRRRASVDSRVAWIYTVVHGVKPWVCVGISRFGTGKPERRPPGITGFSQCD